MSPCLLILTATLPFCYAGLSQLTTSEFQVMFNGVLIPKDCYYGNWMTRLIKGLKGHHEPQEERVFYEVLKYIKPNAHMIELGCFWGYYSAWFLTEIEGASATLVEPDIRNVSVALETLRVNKLSAEVLLGYVPPISPDLIKQELNNEFKTSIQISPFDVNYYFQENRLEKLDLLHVDIQGSEVTLLNDISHLLEGHKIDYLFISTHSQNIHQKCLAKIESFDYVIITEHTLLESFSYDGLIVIRSPLTEGPPFMEIEKR